MSKSRLTILSEIAIFSAISLVFDKVPLFTMPQGGSVSLVML
ncbi:energy-coupled thiamine transporter ThiT, partial [Streptococcus suis]